MKYNLPTREDCQAILKETEAFFVSETVIEGQNVEMYNYRLASLSDFVDNDAFELRGLTFVEQTDGSWERNILLQKFFNINQTDGWMEDDVKDKKITNVANKEDGSIISFIRFANGKIRAKSKMSFESDQAQMAQDVYDKDEKLRGFIDRCLDNTDEFSCRYTPIFELVSPENQIVLEYQNTELILLQIRDNLTGEYLDLFRGINSKLHDKPEANVLGTSIEDTWNIKIAARIMSQLNSLPSLDLLLEQKEINVEPIEGWIVTFDCGQMAKIKTNKYLSLHGLIGPDAFRENLLVKTILDGNIDDVISALVPGVKKDKIIELDEKVVHHFNHLVKEFLDLRELYFDFFKEDRKEFALAKRTFRMFGGVMNSLKVQDEDLENLAETQVKIYIERQCNGLGKAKDYLDKL